MWHSWNYLLITMKVVINLHYSTKLILSRGQPKVINQLNEYLNTLKTLTTSSVKT